MIKIKRDNRTKVETSSIPSVHDFFFFIIFKQIS